MKPLLIIAVLALIILSIVQLFAMSTQKGIETYPYEVVQVFNDFEVRTYEASLFTSVKLASSEYGQTSSNGFSILAGYIFGGNDKNEKIAMTSPVAMTLEESDSTTMMFMVPRNLDKDKLPKPDQDRIEFVDVPVKKMAAVRFGGWTNDEKIEKHKQMLIAGLKREGVSFSNRFYYFGYNAPYEMTNRRNEVLVELD